MSATFLSAKRSGARRSRTVVDVPNECRSQTQKLGPRSVTGEGWWAPHKRRFPTSRSTGMPLVVRGRSSTADLHYKSGGGAQMMDKPIPGAGIGWGRPQKGKFVEAERR